MRIGILSFSRHAHPTPQYVLQICVHACPLDYTKKTQQDLMDNSPTHPRDNVLSMRARRHALISKRIISCEYVPASLSSATMHMSYHYSQAGLRQPSNCNSTHVDAMHLMPTWPQRTLWTEGYCYMSPILICSASKA